MGLLKNLLKGNREREEKLKEWTENDRIGEIVHARKKSHDERELEKVLEKEKQDAIKDALAWEHKRQEAQDRLNARNMMRFNPEFFNQDVVLNQRNLFLRGGFS